MATADQLTAAYMNGIAGVRDRASTYATTLWERSASLRDVDVDQMVGRLIPVVHGAQVQAATITAAYVLRLAEVEGVTPPSLGIDRDAILHYRGVTAEEVYRRPAVATYTALSEGKSFQTARDEGRKRLISLVTTDVQQARNRQARAAYSESGFAYTLRVLSGTENCALCVIASTQRYLKSDLAPLHPGCDCGTRGVRAGRDPGQVINPDLLELTHREIEARLGATDRSARDLGLNKTDASGNNLSDFTDLIVTREHGELGPMLTWRSQKFTSASDIAALEE